MKKQEQSTKKTEVFEMNDIPQIELPRIDVTEYIGRKAKVTKAEVIGTQYGRAIRFETEVIDTLGTKEKPIVVKASKLLSLQQDEAGTWGMGAKTKTQEFFAKWGLKSHKDMIGKIVIVQATEEKNNAQFLTFA